MGGGKDEAGSGFGNRLGLALRLLLVLFWTVLLGGFGAMAWSARNSDDIVIERIDAPADMVAEELKDEALARRVLHELTVMRFQTRDPVHSSGVTIPSHSWMRDFRVEIPQTGLSIADLYTAFRRWLGRDIYVRAGVYKDNESKTGQVLLSLWVRGEATVHKIDSKRPLEVQIAEKIYERAYPAWHAFWLSGDPDPKRAAEGITKFRRIAYNDQHADQRALAFYSLAMIERDDEGRCEEAEQLFLRARRADPQMPTVLSNLADVYNCLGRDQAAADTTREELELLGDGGVKVDRRRRRALELENRILLAGALGDHLEQLRLYEAMGVDGFGFMGDDQVGVLADNKDFPGAMTLLREQFPGKNAVSPWLCYRYFVAREAWPQAASSIVQNLAAKGAERQPYIDRQLLTQIRPLAAIALARAGRFKKAQAALERSGDSDCYLCARSRAAVAEERSHDAARRGEGGESKALAELADRSYQQAIALAPRLPAAYFEWGRARLARGDLEGAVRLFEEASSHGPHWGDPLKYRADALVRMGQDRRATIYYARAARLAPRWFDLHRDWSLALSRIGRRDAAATRATEAMGMKVSARDLAWLERSCAVRKASTGE